MSQYLFKDRESLQNRDLSYLEADKAAVRALAQAAVNVELFTIPLYMTALYSIQGMHQITSRGNNFYQGRLWPGMGTTPRRTEPMTPNQDVFNKVFSVFIAEMLHLQLASNICTTIGYVPTFTSPMLQRPDRSWTCYDGGTIIPHILDLQDTLPDSPFHDVKVKLGAMNEEQVRLFLAIEESGTDAEKNVSPEVWAKNYSPEVPFAGWTPESTEANLPMFGTIGHMYTCLWEYLSMEYTNGYVLWQYMFVPGAVQHDLFNDTSKGSKAQYPSMSTSVTSEDPEKALLQVLNMIDGITDQGEGKEVADGIRRRLKLAMPRAVEQKYQPNEENIAEDYPSYSDTGVKKPVSADATARGGKNAAMDHFEIFTAVQDLIKHPGYMTWDTWHQQGNTWRPEALVTTPEDYEINRKNYPQLPEAEDIATALNNLKYKDGGANYDLLSRASTGSIAGMTTVLNKYWLSEDAEFPMPAMGGTGDRMSICWAIFGQAPNLSLGVPEKDDQHVLYHACQGLNLDPSQPDDPNSCAAVSVYHTCIGSNDCRSQGGCGFVQSTAGGGSCSHSGTGKSTGNTVLCGAKTYSGPSDNKCGAFGGCAVPISASQMYPDPKDPNNPKGPMEYYNFVQKPDGTWSAVDMKEKYVYEKGQLVYDVAWDMYTKVLETNKKPIPEKPKPSDLRIAFPPST